MEIPIKNIGIKSQRAQVPTIVGGAYAIEIGGCSGKEYCAIECRCF